AEVNITLGTPAVINDAELVARMMPTLERVTTVNSLTPQTVAEDFSIFANQTPGIFMFLGNGAPGVDPKSLPSNHSPMFDMYEPSLEIGVRVFSNLVVDYLQAE
ncbi:MAG TPA: M20/M25/M40 family metallo-hydrolase, partial [Xanthomonadales bacterium]|nr:M20/M25/M40 family metallo-hydrolase [Xanthomonadales bacterium]